MGCKLLCRGGCATKTTIKSGYQAVFKKGKAIDTIVKGKHGQQFVEEGGCALKTTVSDGGVQEVYEGARVEDTVIDKDGKQKVHPNAYTKNTMVKEVGVLEFPKGTKTEKVKLKHSDSLTRLPIHIFAIKIKDLLSKFFRTLLIKTESVMVRKVKKI